MKFPVTTRARQNRSPKEKQQKNTFRITFFMAEVLPETCISATVGSIMVAMELVMAEGKRTQGRAMPVRTP